jgi:hypothetical protein
MADESVIGLESKVNLFVLLRKERTMKTNRLLATLLAGMLCFSLLGATAKTEDTDIPTVDPTETTVDGDDEEVVLDFTLDDKDEFKKDLTADDFKLSYGFGNMTVKSIEWTGDLAFSVTLDGEIDKNFPSGEISVLASAFTNGGEEFDITYQIQKPVLYIAYDEYSFKDGVLGIPLTLTGCGFLKTASAADITITGADGFEVVDLTVVDAQNAYVNLSAEGYDNIDDALTALDNAAAENGASIEVSGNAVTTIEGGGMNLTVPFAAVVPMVEETSLNDDGTVQVLVRLFGYSSEKAIDATYISLGGDFKYDGGVTGVTLDETTGETLLSFPIDATKAASEDYMILGTITLASGAMKNPWGTMSKAQTDRLSVSLEEAFLVPVEEETAETAETAETMGYVPFEEIGTYSYMPYEDEKPEVLQVQTELKLLVDGLKLIPGSELLSKPLAKFNKIYDYAQKLGSFFGLFPEKESKEQQILNSLKNLEKAISNVNTAVQQLREELLEESAKTRIRSFHTELAAIHSTVKLYQDAVKANTITQLKPSGMTRAKVLTKEFAEELLSCVEYEDLTKAEQEAAIALVNSTSQKLYSGQINTAEEVIASLGGKNSNTAKIVLGKVGSVVGEEYFKTTVNGHKFPVSFMVVCNEITGITGGHSIVKDVDDMIESTYNWENETTSNRVAYRTFLSSCLLEASNVLSMCYYGYDPNMSTATEADAYNAAYNYYMTGAGKVTWHIPQATQIEQYCITLGKTLILEDSEKWTKIKMWNATGVLKEDDLKKIMMRAHNLGRSLEEDMRAGYLEQLRFDGPVRTTIFVGPVKEEKNVWYGVVGRSAKYFDINDKTGKMTAKEMDLFYYSYANSRTAQQVIVPHLYLRAK